MFIRAALGRYAQRAAALSQLQLSSVLFRASLTQSAHTVPVRPKPPITNFIRFFLDHHAEVRKLNEGLGLRACIATVVSKWKELPAAEKENYNIKYKAEKAQHDAEVAKWEQSITPADKVAIKEARLKVRIVKIRAKRKGMLRELAKQCNKPKRPLSALFLYLGDVRDALRKANPGMKMSEIMVLGSQQFKAQSPAEMKTYEDLAAQCRVKYEKEMASYTPPSIPPMPALPSLKPAVKKVKKVVKVKKPVKKVIKKVATTKTVKRSV